MTVPWKRNMFSCYILSVHTVSTAGRQYLLLHRYNVSNVWLTTGTCYFLIMIILLNSGLKSTTGNAIQLQHLSGYFSLSHLLLILHRTQYEIIQSIQWRPRMVKVQHMSTHELCCKVWYLLFQYMPRVLKWSCQKWLMVRDSMRPIAI